MESPLGPLAPEHLSEFIVGLVLAAVVALVVQKVVVPRFEQMYSDRAAEIEGGINRAQLIRAEAEEVKRQYQEQLALAREDSAKLREEARIQGATILEEARREAHLEAERIRVTAGQQILAEREQALQELRADVGVLASRLAERIIGEALTDTTRTQRTVDRFLAELDTQPSRLVPDYLPDTVGSASEGGGSGQ